MKKVFKALQEVWDSAPKEIQERDDYVFVLSWDWKGVPSQFYKKAVYRSKDLPNNTIYYMPNPCYRIYVEYAKIL